MTAPSRAVRYFVAGRVQGVFYRASAASEARRLGISGWAKNLPDGRVEVVASGSEEALSEFAEWLWQGPRSAIVDRVDVETWDDEIGADFDVR